MSNVNIKYLGGIHDKEQGVSLTGSSTLMSIEKLDNLKILFDFGMFQGAGKESELNSITDEAALKADFLVITHAHMDHIGRLPLLVKNGFKGRIIMSNITKQLALPMLTDYVNLTQNQINEAETHNKNISTRLRLALKISKLNDDLIKNNLGKKEKEKLQFKLDKETKNLTIEKAVELLENFGIENVSDIQNIVISKVPELLYDIDDIYTSISKIETLEVGNELNLDNRIVIKTASDEIIEELPGYVKNGSKKKIYVLPHLKKYIINRWKREYDKISELWNEDKAFRKELSISFKFVNVYESKKTDNLEVPEGYTHDEEHFYHYSKGLLAEFGIRYNSDIKEIRHLAIIKLNKAFNFISDYLEKCNLEGIDINNYTEEYDKNISNNNSDLLTENSIFIQDEYELYLENKEILDFHKINNDNDLENVSNELKKEYEGKYSKQDLDEAKKSLHVIFDKPNQSVIESFKLKFYEAGHIEGSIQALVTLVTSKVDNIINHASNSVGDKFGYEVIKTWYENYLFTGDLGKFTDPNYSGKPGIPEFKIDYVQCESTYALKSHPNKKQEFERFISEINSAEGKVLIPAFSLQRTQEIMVELFINKQENLALIEKFNKLNKKIKKIRLEYNKLNKITELSRDEQLIKTDLFSKISLIDEDLSEIKNKVLLTGIITDSPLSNRVSEIFRNNLPEKYKLLSPDYQKHIFGKELVINLEKGEFDDLYSDKRIKSKDVIISSGGMLQGGAVINHLEKIVSDPKAKIIFTGYQSFGTLGEEILSGAKTIKISGVEHEVKCQIVQIRGYSSHIGGDDIENYLTKHLNYNKGATIALTHGGNSREELRDRIISTKKKLNVIVPKLFDVVSV